MKQRPFKQVDVFTSRAYRGNPLAVVLDGSGLDDEAMQHFAHWTHLSETSFLLPPTRPDADYRVRIFTPGAELSFAGHPTLGSCHAWLEAGGVAHNRRLVVQECNAGLVKIRRAARHLAFSAPPMKRSSPSPAVLAQVASALGLKARQVIAAQLLDNGPAWLSLLLDQPATVLGLAPDHGELKRLGVKVGVAGIYPNGSGEPSCAPLLEVRAFAAAIGIEEDPVTGSLNASLAQWLIPEGLLPAAYVAAQGTCLGREGRVRVECDDSQQVWIGGESLTCITGEVSM